MIGNKLKQLRENKGINQTEISNMLNIKQASYSNYENNKREPDIKTIKALADFYNVTTDFLLEHDQNNEKEKLLTIEETKIINELKDLFIKKKTEI